MNKRFHALSQRIYCLLISLSWGILPVFAAPPLHVSTTGLATNDGLTWATATTLQHALAIATNTQEVWVQTGTYKPGTLRTASFNLTDGVQLLGGFPVPTATLPNPNLSNRNSIANPTILSGEIGVAGIADNSLHVVVAYDLMESTLVDGFTIRDGNANDGTDFLSIVDGNEYGGGFLVVSRGLHLSIQQCLFTRNRADYGGGMFNQYASPKLTNCVFTENTATDYGGGMANAYSSPSLTNCVFTANTAAVKGGGMYNYIAAPHILNGTFVSNSAGTAGGGIFGEVYPTNYDVINTILWNNQLTDHTLSNYSNLGSNGAHFKYSNIQGLSPLVDFSMSQDPLFFDINNPAGADGIFRTADDGLRLTAFSSSVNTGTNINAPNFDILEVVRPQSGIVDMGAYEFQGSQSNPTLLISASANPIYPNTSVTFTAETTNEGNNPTFQWFKNGILIIGANSRTYTDATLNHNDRITCVMNNTVFSGGITMIVNAPSSPQIQIYVVGGVWRIETGIPLTFNALVTNGTPTSVYLWFKNGVAVGTNSPTYTDSALRDGDEIWCQVTNGVPSTGSGVSQRIAITVLPRAVCNCH